jgi:N-acetylglucosamine-6-phosphate deacetylase
MNDLWPSIHLLLARPYWQRKNLYMADILIKNARNQAWLLVRDGRIEDLGQGEPVVAHSADQTIDAGGLHLLPGFIDVHVHGAMDHDTMDARPEALQQMAEFYAQHGVTGFLATTWTDSRSRIDAALSTIKQCIGPQPNGATLLGAHMEGPYLNPARSGAQNTEFVRTAIQEEALDFLDSGVIRLISLAPEYEEHSWLVQEAVRRGITVSAAHTNATYQETCRAIKLGLSHSTHTFNAMTGLHHRNPGVVGAVMASPDVACELIADNIHVHPAVMKILWQAKKPDKLMLVTDAVRVAGLSVGEYMLDSRKIYVDENSVRLADGTLAGSILTMDVALQHFLAATGEKLETAWQVSSLNAAQSIGLDDHKGKLDRGYDADVILVDEELTVHLTIAQGTIVYRRNS